MSLSGKQAQPSERPAQQEQIPQERVLVQYLGKPVDIDKNKEARAAQLFFSLAQRSPDQYGIITPAEADDNVKQAMQQISFGLANFTAIDLACESIVDENTPCKKIDENYQNSRSGIPSHFQLFPPAEYTCEGHRGVAKNVLYLTRGECGQIEDPEIRAACEDMPRGCMSTKPGTPSNSICLSMKNRDISRCTEYEGFQPCPLLVATGAAVMGGLRCTDLIQGHAAYLCEGIAMKNCKIAYKEMIQDYTYTEMALTTGENGFCQLVDEPSIKSGCLAGDKDTVRKDLIKGYD